jgi:hypothetical protein
VKRHAKRVRKARKGAVGKLTLQGGASTYPKGKSGSGEKRVKAPSLGPFFWRLKL